MPLTSLSISKISLQQNNDRCLLTPSERYIYLKIVTKGCSLNFLEYEKAQEIRSRCVQMN